MIFLIIVALAICASAVIAGLLIKTLFWLFIVGLVAFILVSLGAVMRAL
jgi:hypothetical protein